jgi:hypothetical protein
MIHEHVCYNRRFTATTGLRPAGSPLRSGRPTDSAARTDVALVLHRAVRPSPDCTSMRRALPVPRAGLAAFATNRHESSGLADTVDEEFPAAIDRDGPCIGLVGLGLLSQLPMELGNEATRPRPRRRGPGSIARSPARVSPSATTIVQRVLTLGIQPARVAACIMPSNGR